MEKMENVYKLAKVLDFRLMILIKNAFLVIIPAKDVMELVMINVQDVKTRLHFCSLLLQMEIQELV